MAANHPQAAFRKRRGLTQRAFAEKIGVNRFTVCAWEAYRSTPQRRYWPKIRSISNGELTPNDYLMPSEAAE